MRDRTSEEYKKAIVRKLSTTTLSQRQFAIEEGIGFSTLHKWKTKYAINSTSHNHSQPAKSNGWSAEQKFGLVLESASLSELELGEYCRRKGIYTEQLCEWRQACIQGNMKANDQKKKIDAASKADKKRIKELERELARKDKALAEAAALLILRKKLDALWSDDEEH